MVKRNKSVVILQCSVKELDPIAKSFFFRSEYFSGCYRSGEKCIENDFRRVSEKLMGTFQRKRHSGH